MILENEYTVKLSEIGKGNKATNKTILSYLEDIGGIHSNIAGYGVFEIAQTNLSWILLGWRLQVIRRPKYAEKVKIKTWSKGVVKFYTYCDFEIYDEQGNLIIKASSKWVLLDIEKGKIVTVVWYNEFERNYIQLTGEVKGINPQKKYKDTYRLNFGTEYKIDETISIFFYRTFSYFRDNERFAIVEKVDLDFQIFG